MEVKAPAPLAVLVEIHRLMPAFRLSGHIAPDQDQRISPRLMRISPGAAVARHPVDLVTVIAVEEDQPFVKRDEMQWIHGFALAVQ
jgi:hypothetical protein